LVASGSGITSCGAVASPDGRRLADLAPTARALLGLPADSDQRAGKAANELLSSASACGRRSFR
jgi:hypothetical protein